LPCSIHNNVENKLRPLMSPRMSVMRVILVHPCTKFEVRRSPLRKVWRIFRLSINRQTSKFDLSTSKWVADYPRHVLPSRQFSACCVLPFSTCGQARDRQTDGETDDGRQCLMPVPYGAGHNKHRLR